MAEKAETIQVDVFVDPKVLRAAKARAEQNAQNMSAITRYIASLAIAEPGLYGKQLRNTDMADSERDRYRPKVQREQWRAAVAAVRAEGVSMRAYLEGALHHYALHGTIR